MDWHEVPPESVDMDPAAVAAMLEWLERRSRNGLLGGQLVVLRRGQVVLDRAFGVAHWRSRVPVTPSTLFLLYSASKPYVALLTHLLTERGTVSLDDPIASHWPEFARHGKDRITLRHVLQHRAGVPVDRSPLSVVTMPDWAASVHRTERLRPQYPAGEVTAYHPLTFGFILGEVIRRITGVPVERFLREELLDPLDLQDTHLGLPPQLWERRAEVYARRGVVERGSAFVFNRPRYRQAVIPAASVSSTARDVALFYEMLRRDGTLDGVRVLKPETVAEARRPSAEGQVDRSSGWRTRWAQGLCLGGYDRPGDFGMSMGKQSSWTTFGHSGSQCCNVWVDPERELVFAYLTGQLMSGSEGIPLLGELSDLTLAACR